MTNAESLASVVTALGGTPSGKTNTELIAEIVTALGGTPAGDSNDELIAKVATAFAAATENLAPENIKKDVAILGVTGAYEGSGGGGEWRLWDGEEALADEDGAALLDVYLEADHEDYRFSCMVPKGGAIAPYGDVAFVAGGHVRSGACILEAHIDSGGLSGFWTVIPLTPGNPPVAGTVEMTALDPADARIYVRDSQGLPS